MFFGFGSSCSAVNRPSVSAGGGLPPWWDEDALVDIDFVNDRAWTAADGEVAIDTLIGNDPDSSGWWGTSSYDPESTVIGSGYESSGGFCFLGAVETLVLGGCTMRIEGMVYESMSSMLSLVAASESPNGEFSQVDIASLDVTVTGNVVDESAVGVYIADQVNVTAFTLAPARAEVAVNGTLVITALLTEDDWPTSGDLPDLTGCSFGQNVPGKRITIYSPLPDTTGLVELSALPSNS